MATKRLDPEKAVHKRASTKTTATWLRNAVKSIGGAGADVIQSISPNIYETASSVAQVATKVRKEKITTNAITNVIKNNPYIQMGRKALDNAMEDLKSGNLNNTDRMISSQDSGESDGASTYFGDFDSEEGGADSAVPNVNVQLNPEGLNSINTSIQKQTKSQLIAQKANVDAIIASTSATMAMAQRNAEASLNMLTNIHNSLQALVAYNNETMTDYIQKASAYYEAMGKIYGSDKGNDASPNGERLDGSRVTNQKGALDVKKFKDLFLQNAKEAFGNSAPGRYMSLIKNNGDQLISNPIGFAMSMAMQFMIPDDLGKAAESLDKTFGNFMTNAIAKASDRLAKVADSAITGNFFQRKIMGPVANFVGKALNINVQRKDKFSTAGKVTKDAAIFDGITRNAIIGEIPRYLRESTAYLRQLVELAGGDANQAVRGSQIFNRNTGTYDTYENFTKSLMDGVNDSITQAFELTDFGKSMNKIASSLEESGKRDDFEKILRQFYSAVEKDDRQFINIGKTGADSEIAPIIESLVGSDEMKKMLQYAVEESFQAGRGGMSFNPARLQAKKARNAYLEELESNNIVDISSMVKAGKEGTNVDQTMARVLYGTGENQESARVMAHVNPLSIGGHVKTIEQILLRGIKVQIVPSIDPSGAGGDAGSQSNASGGSSSSQPSGDSGDQPPTPSNSSMTEEEMRNAASEAMGTQRMTNGKGASKFLQNKSLHMQNMMHYMISGNTSLMFSEMSQMFGDAVGDVRDKVGDAVVKPLKKKLFGEKNDKGFRDKGLLTTFMNKATDTKNGLLHMLDGRKYEKSDGTKVDEKDKKDSILGTAKGFFTDLKDDAKSFFFGKEDKDKEGVVAKGKQMFAEGLKGWKEALFGKGDAAKEAKEELEKKLQERMPDMVGGAITGGMLSLGAGGLLGSVVGGPLTGILVGSAVGFAKQSKGFQKFVFGNVINPDGSVKKTDEGLISQKTQEFFKKNKADIAGGAAVGAGVGLITGGGLLGSLIGGPLAGALMGSAVGMLKNSDKFKEFLWGKEDPNDPDKKKKIGGILNYFNKAFDNLGGKKPNSDGSVERGRKALGMTSVGVGAGLLASLVTPIGPIGGAMLGLAGSIAAEKDNFHDFLFGKDNHEGDNKGVIGRFGSLIKANILNPLKDKMKDFMDTAKDAIIEKVMHPLEWMMQPFSWLARRLYNATIGRIGKAVGKIKDAFVDFGKRALSGIGGFLKKKADGIFGKIFGGAGKILKGVLGIGGGIMHGLGTMARRSNEKASLREADAYFKTDDGAKKKKDLDDQWRGMSKKARENKYGDAGESGYKKYMDKMKRHVLYNSDDKELEWLKEKQQRDKERKEAHQRRTDRTNQEALIANLTGGKYNEVTEKNLQMARDAFMDSKYFNKKKYSGIKRDEVLRLLDPATLAKNNIQGSNAPEESKNAATAQILAEQVKLAQKEFEEMKEQTGHIEKSRMLLGDIRDAILSFVPFTSEYKERKTAHIEKKAAKKEEKLEAKLMKRDEILQDVRNAEALSAKRGHDDTSSFIYNRTYSSYFKTISKIRKTSDKYSKLKQGTGDYSSIRDDASAVSQLATELEDGIKNDKLSESDIRDKFKELKDLYSRLVHNKKQKDHEYFERDHGILAGGKNTAQRLVGEKGKRGALQMHDAAEKRKRSFAEARAAGLDPEAIVGGKGGYGLHDLLNATGGRGYRHGGKTKEGAAVVGENGPEIVSFGSNDKVLSNDSVIKVRVEEVSTNAAKTMNENGTVDVNLIGQNNPLTTYSIGAKLDQHTDNASTIEADLEKKDSLVSYDHIKSDFGDDDAEFESSGSGEKSAKDLIFGGLSTIVDGAAQIAKNLPTIGLMAGAIYALLNAGTLQDVIKRVGSAAENITKFFNPDETDGPVTSGVNAVTSIADVEANNITDYINPFASLNHTQKNGAGESIKNSYATEAKNELLYKMNLRNELMYPSYAQYKGRLLRDKAAGFRDLATSAKEEGGLLQDWKFNRYNRKADKLDAKAQALENKAEGTKGSTTKGFGRQVARVGTIAATSSILGAGVGWGASKLGFDEKTSTVAQNVTTAGSAAFLSANLAKTAAYNANPLNKGKEKKAIVDKIIDGVGKLINLIADKVGANDLLKAGKKAISSNSVVTKIKGLVSKATKAIRENITDPITDAIEKRIAMLTGKSAVGAGTLGLGIAVSAVAGLCSGFCSTAHLFNVAPEDADAGMKAVSSILSAAFGAAEMVPALTYVVGCIDIIDMMLQPLFEMGIKQKIAELIYEIFGGSQTLEEKQAAFAAEKSAYEEKFGVTMDSATYNDMVNNTGFFDRMWNGKTTKDEEGNRRTDAAGNMLKTGGVKGLFSGAEKKYVLGEDGLALKDKDGNAVLARDALGNVKYEDEKWGNKVAKGFKNSFAWLTGKDVYEVDENGDAIYDPETGEYVVKDHINGVADFFGGLFGSKKKEVDESAVKPLKSLDELKSERVPQFMGGPQINTREIEDTFSQVQDITNSSMSFVDNISNSALQLDKDKIFDKNSPSFILGNLSDDEMDVMARAMTNTMTMMSMMGDTKTSSSFNKNVSNGIKAYPDVYGNTVHGGNGEGGYGNAPFYSQKDPRWSGMSYEDDTDDATMANAGCGPAAFAMAASGATGTNIDPVSSAQTLKAVGARDETGTNWNGMMKAANAYGIDATMQRNPSETFIDNELAQGNPVVLSGKSGGYGNTPYTPAGHYVVATGKDSEGNYIINDPNKTSGAQRYRKDDIMKETGAAWGFGGRGVSNTNAVALANDGGSSSSTAKEQKADSTGTGVVPEDVISIAKNEVGYVEKNDASDLDNKTGGGGDKNFTKYARDLQAGGMGHTNGQYWCATFVVWCFWQAANRDKKITTDLLCNATTAACASNYQAFQKAGRWVGKNEAPQPGDVIFYETYSHTGLVVACDGSTITTVEGNTSGDNKANRNGGCVAVKTRKVGDNSIRGYGRPMYDGTSNFKGVSSYESSGSESSASSTDGGATQEKKGFWDIIGSWATEMGNKVLGGITSGTFDTDWSSWKSSIGGSSSGSSASSGSSSSSDSGATNSNIPAANINPNEVSKQAWKYFTGIGYSKAATAGILGNFQAESGMDPTRLQKGGPAAGIAQWESYRDKSGRWKALSDYANSKGRDWTDLQSQLEFVHKELQGLNNYFSKDISYGGNIPGSTHKNAGSVPTTYEKWKQSTDVDMATRQFEAAFERAGKPHMDKRVAAAKAYYDQLANSSGNDKSASERTKSTDTQFVDAGGMGNGNNNAPRIIKKKFIDKYNNTLPKDTKSSTTHGSGMYTSMQHDKDSIYKAGGKGSGDMVDMATIKDYLAQIVDILGVSSDKLDNLQKLDGISTGGNTINNTLIQSPQSGKTDLKQTKKNPWSEPKTSASKYATAMRIANGTGI